MLGCKHISASTPAAVQVEVHSSEDPRKVALSENEFYRFDCPLFIETMHYKLWRLDQGSNPNILEPRSTSNLDEKMGPSPYTFPLPMVVYQRVGVSSLEVEICADDHHPLEGTWFVVGRVGWGKSEQNPHHFGELMEECSKVLCDLFRQPLIHNLDLNCVVFP